MLRTFACVACLAALPVYAQTAGDDLPAAENWWDRVGAGFFSDEGLTALRPEHEILAQWTALSADDQAAVRARCALLTDPGSRAETSGTTVPSQQLGSNTELGASQTAQAGQDDAVELPADAGTPQPDDAPDISAEAADQTSITGAVDGDEVHRPAEGIEPYTGLGGGVTPSDAQLEPVCSVIAGI